jgi:hypothetical protein
VFCSCKFGFLFLFVELSLDVTQHSARNYVHVGVGSFFGLSVVIVVIILLSCISRFCVDVDLRSVQMEEAELAW